MSSLVLRTLFVLIAPSVLAPGVADVAADERDPDKDVVKPVRHRKTQLSAYPYAFYTPETELAIGAGGIITFFTGQDTVLRPSSLTVSAYYSTRKQYKVSLTPQIYFSANERYLSAPASFGHYVDKFWGIGNQTPDFENPDYQVNAVDLKVQFQVPTIVRVFHRVGAIYEFNHSDVVDKLDNKVLQADTVVGSNGGVTSGAGLTWVTDSRDHTFYPSRGWLIQVEFLGYTNVLGSDFGFTKTILNVRRYSPLGGEQILATQFYFEGTTGTPPFYKLPALGGAERMRGYFTGRYRDAQYLTGQVEYRRDLFWKLGGVAFLGAGAVAPWMSAFRLDSLHYSYGFGLRYLFNVEEHVNLRMDIGWGRDTSGVYFGMNEAF